MIICDGDDIKKIIIQPLCNRYKYDSNILQIALQIGYLIKL